MDGSSGAPDRQRLAKLRRLLTSIGWAPVDAIADFEGRRRSTVRAVPQASAPRGLIDCLIANVAMRSHAPRATDRDFPAMAQVVPLRLAEA